MLTWCQPKLQNNRLIKSSPAQFAKKLWHPIWWNAANVIIWTAGHALMYGFRRTKHVQTAMQLTRHLPNPTCLWQTELLRLSSNALPVLLSLCTQDHISLSAKEWTFTRNLKGSNFRTHKNNYAQQIIYIFSGWTRKTEGLKCWMMKFSAMFVKN